MKYFFLQKKTLKILYTNQVEWLWLLSLTGFDQIKWNIHSITFYILRIAKDKMEFDILPYNKTE